MATVNLAPVAFAFSVTDFLARAPLSMAPLNLRASAAAVRGVAWSTIANLAASFPSKLFRHLWESKGERQGLADVLNPVESECITYM